MKFWELVYKYKWDEICPVLISLYPNDQQNIAGFKMVFEQLRTLTLSETNMRIILEEVFDEFENEWYTCVSGRDGALKKEENPEIFKDDKIGNQEVAYGIEFVDWEEWLGMDIDPESIWFWISKKQSIQLIEKNKRAKLEERETGEDIQLNVIIIDKILQPKGVLFTFDKKGKQVRILFLTHAIDRMAKWKLTPEMVGETLLEPKEVLIGHHNRFIAHKCYGHHILRAVYEYDDLIPSLITVYFPYKDRYYEGGERFENKILK